MKGIKTQVKQGKLFRSYFDMNRFVKMLGKKSIDETFVWEEYMKTTLILFINFVFNPSMFKWEYNTWGLAAIIVQCCKYFIKLCETQLRRRFSLQPATFKKIGKTYSLIYIDALRAFAYEKLGKGNLEGFGSSIHKALN